MIPCCHVSWLTYIAALHAVPVLVLALVDPGRPVITRSQPRAERQSWLLLSLSSCGCCMPNVPVT